MGTGQAPGHWDSSLKQDPFQFFPSSQSALGLPLAFHCPPLQENLPVIARAPGFLAVALQARIPLLLIKRDTAPLPWNSNITAGSQLNAAHTIICLCHREIGPVQLCIFNSRYTKGMDLPIHRRLMSALKPRCDGSTITPLLC